MIKPDAASDNPSALSIRRIGQLSDFSKRVTCRLARSYAERDAIFKLRYQACLRAGSISQNSFGRHIEPADHAANAYLMGLYVDRRLVSSLRLQVGSATTPNFSSLELFPHAFEPILRDNKTVVDMGGVAGDGQLARSYVWLPYIVLRPWILAAERCFRDYQDDTTRGFRVPGFFETTVAACSSPALIALCMAARNASSIFSCTARIDISSITSSSIIASSPMSCE